MAEQQSPPPVAASAGREVSRRFDACACGARQVCPKFLEAFGVSVCSVCKADEALLSKVRELVDPVPANTPLTCLPPPSPPPLSLPPDFALKNA